MYSAPSPVHLFLIINVTLCNLDLVFAVLQNIFFRYNIAALKISYVLWCFKPVETYMQTLKNVVIQAKYILSNTVT